jgi:hypothetical protein
MGINSFQAPQSSPFERILGAVQGVQSTVQGFKDSARKDVEQKKADAQHAELSRPDSPLMASIREYSAAKGIQVPENLNYLQFEKTPLKAAVDARIKGDEEIRMASAKGKSPTELKQNQFAAAGFSKMARAADSSLERLMSKGFDPTSLGTQAQGLAGAIPKVGGLFESFKSQEMKGYEQAKRQFVQAVLRKESGATITPDEMDMNEKKYFPQAGDGPEVLAQKKQAREQAVAALEGEGSPALGQVQTVAYSKPTGGGGPSGAPTANAASPQDAEALQWAKSNAKDPRAAAIMAKLKAKGFQ